MFLDFSNVETKESKKMGLFYGPGYSICETFIINIIEKLIDFEDLIMNDENWKEQYKEWREEVKKHPEKLSISSGLIFLSTTFIPFDFAISITHLLVIPSKNESGIGV